MKTLMRICVVLFVLAALLPVRTVQSQAEPADPVCAAVAAELGLTYESIWLDGAITCTLYPPRLRWNRDVVIFAHGYIDARQPIGIPWEGQLIREGVNIPQLITSLGYAFSTTSYARNGLAVQEGVTDVVKLAKHVRAANSRVRRVFLTGASEGGLVTTLGIERYPTVFAGGLSTCGPIGSFTGQVQYWEDFRVAFDTYFPNVLLMPFDPVNMVVPYGPSTPIYIDPFVVENWEMVADTYVVPNLVYAPDAVEALLTQTGVPIDLADPVNTAGASILELLYYNVQATNDGRLTLNPDMTPDQLLPPSMLGNPYENLDYITEMYPEGLQRDPVAAQNMKAYETSGKPGRQLVIMHTTGDPVIPFAQPLRYLAKALKAGKLSRTAFIPVDRYGHCNFTAPELVLGFYTMVLRATHLPFSSKQIRATLPDAAQQVEFKQLKEDNR